jgi:hypothetical protein
MVQMELVHFGVPKDWSPNQYDMHHLQPLPCEVHASHSPYSIQVLLAAATAIALRSVSARAGPEGAKIMTVCAASESEPMRHEPPVSFFLLRRQTSELPCAPVRQAS